MRGLDLGDGRHHRAAFRSGTHASRWAGDELVEHAPRPARLRADRRAGHNSFSSRTRVGPSELYGYDAHGNIAFLTDGSGAETDTYRYDAWGNLIESTGSTSNTRLFAGEEFDPDLGLIELRARQYNAGTGRFLTIDPLDKVRPTTFRGITVTSAAITIANDPYIQSVVLLSAEAVGPGQAPTEPLDLDRYLYANADPVRLGDPTGLEAEEEAELEGSFSTGTVRVAEKVGRNSGCEVEFLVKVLSCASRYGGNQMGFDICVASAARAYAVCRETGLPN